MVVGMIAVIATLSGCSRKTKVLDYSQYPKLPMTVGTKSFRLLTRTPLTRDRIYWGRYGGPGNRGGEPIDALDEIFRKHDIAYCESETREDVKKADELMIEELVALDDLDPKAEKFRDRAVKFFTSPISQIIGKPWALVFNKRRIPTAKGMDPVTETPPREASK